MLFTKSIWLLAVASASALRGPVPPRGARAAVDVRGGADDDDAGDLFGAADAESVEAKVRGGMVSAAKMMGAMRGDAGPSAAVAALEAAASAEASSVAELLELYLVARADQALELAGSDALDVALRQVANEALAYRASTRLPVDAAARVLKTLADAAGADSAEAYEADVVSRSALAVKELLAVLADSGNFVAAALAHADAKIPAIEADVEEDLGLGNDAAVQAGRSVLEKLRSWQNDSQPLEQLRVSLLSELEDAPEHDRPRVAAALRPVVANVLGPEFSS